MKYNQELDKRMKDGLNQQVRNIEPSGSLFNQIKLNIYEKEQEKMMNTKKFSFKNRKKLLITAGLCIAITSITVIGSSLGKSWVGHTNNKYMTFPSEEKVQKDVGFTPKYAEELPGGFRYIRGGYGESELRDEVNNVLTKTPQVSFMYTRDKDDQKLTLGAQQIAQQYFNHEGSQLVATYQGLPIYYTEQTYKFVPVEYEMTEEDKQALETGTMEISVGASEVSIEQYQHISWYEEGLLYYIAGFDGDFTVEEMIEMVQFIVDKNDRKSSLNTLSK